MELLQHSELYSKYSEQIIKDQLEDIAESNYRASEKIAIAKETLEELLAEGFPIVFSVPLEYIEKVKTNGLTLNETFIPGFKLLAGTIGIEPYNPEGNRPLVILHPSLAKKYGIQPRFTGPNVTFNGIISTNREIPIADLEIIEKPSISMETTNIQEETKTKITKLAS